MIAKDAERLGYRVVAASAAEVGLIKGDKGVMSWWCLDFDRKFPPLDHPKILEVIERHEKYEMEMKQARSNRNKGAGPGATRSANSSWPAPPRREQGGVMMLVLLWIAKMPAGWVLWFVGEGR